MRFVDSHTEGEPTRVILDGGPDLGSGLLADRVRRFASHYDTFRSAVIHEPRGTDALVGALLCEPEDSSCAAGVVFFNNKGYLGMCGHGMMGVAVTLGYLGRIGAGLHRIETPVGVVSVELAGENEVTIENVPSYRHRENVSIDVKNLGKVTGDIAWGGNWFFLTERAPFPLLTENIGRLTEVALSVRRVLRESHITGAEGGEIDHLEFFGPPVSKDANSRNFVLCPGGAYDRSPCGTGTSAKLACLAASGKLKPGQLWVQESIIGSRFAASYQLDSSDRVIPKITGRAYVCSEGQLVQHPNDPFAHGIR